MALVTMQKRDGTTAEAEFPFLGDGSADAIEENMGEEWAAAAIVEKAYAFARNQLTTWHNKGMSQAEMTKAAAGAKPGTRRTGAEAVIAKISTMAPEELKRIQEQVAEALKAQGSKAKAA